MKAEHNKTIDEIEQKHEESLKNLRKLVDQAGDKKQLEQFD